MARQSSNDWWKWFVTSHPLKPVYTIQPTTSWMFVYTMQPVVQPVWQPVVSCKRGFRGAKYCDERVCMSSCVYQWWANLKSNLTLKFQIFPEKYLNHLAKSQILIFFLKSQIFQVNSQIKFQVFRENESVNRFSTGSRHGDISCTF